MGELLERGDANKDGALDKGELKKVFESFRNRGQRPDGAGRPGQDGGNRPQRPDRSKRDQKSRKEQPRRNPEAKKKGEA